MQCVPERCQPCAETSGFPKSYTTKLSSNARRATYTKLRISIGSTLGSQAFKELAVILWSKMLEGSLAPTDRGAVELGALGEIEAKSNQIRVEEHIHGNRE
jgi:hypothetical protein